ncbi:MAG: ABC transporter permease subunit, partial [Ruthenibacterium sp.]
ICALKLMLCKNMWGVNMERKNKRLNGIKLLLVAFFIVTVIAPLLVMLSHMADVDVFAILQSEQFSKGLVNSLLLATVATIVSVGLALLLAFALERSNIRHKSIWSVVFTLPMLIPSISHGMGLILLFGANGIITNFLHLNWNIYGFGGVLTGSVMYSFPVAFLMLADVLRYEDCTPYEAAAVLGIPRANRWTGITFPYLRKPLISVVFATFTLVITDYGVPLMVGGKFATLPVLMYQEVIGLLNFGKGSVIGAVLLIPAVIAFVIDLLNKDKAGESFITKKARIVKNTLRDGAAYLLCIAVALFVVVPIVAFCMLSLVKKYPVDISFSFDNIAKAFQMNAGQFLLNSLLIALAVSVFGTAFSYITAYVTARAGGKYANALHLFAITSMAIPGLVLGLSFVLFFKNTWIYGTIFILMLVNLIHFFSSPYLMAYNSFHKVNSNLEAVGVTLGISRFYILKDVLVPQMKDTIIEMASYFFVNCMMTISAVSFLYTVNTMPVSLMITQFEAQMLLECSAFISVVILTINILAKGVTYLLKNYKREKKETV